MSLPREIIRALPKTDLHLHLDGSLRLGTLIDLAKERHVELPSYTEEGLNELVFRSHYNSLVEYLQGFNYTCAVLTDAEALERTAYELAWDNINEGVRYIEVRFAPQLHIRPNFSLEEVIRAINKGFEKAQNEYNASDPVTKNGEPPFYYGLITCAMRFFTAESSPYYAKLMDVFREAPLGEIYSMASLELARAVVRLRDEEDIPIVGFDLAGAEAGHPASEHEAAYHYVHKNFMHKTVHAGEAYGPESIFQAITDLHADRIGHGYHLFSPELCGPSVADPQRYIQRLIRHIADSRITIEVCMTSNLQTNPAIGSPENHAFGKMLANNLSATLCTDNRLVSHTTVTDEVELAMNTFNINPKQLRDIIVYGFKRSFFYGPYTQRRKYVRQVLNYYDSIIAAYEAKK
ncbi:MAG: adenosine deaminase family protein [bacterium]|nr:adenosine deaminase family protein [bacterium]